MPEIYFCGQLAKLLPEAIDAVNGVAPAPDAVTVGAVRLYFKESPSEALKAHEAWHVEQAARFAPRWVPRWLPLEWRAWAGTPAFWRAYLREFAIHGYEQNFYEREAREKAGQL